MKKYDVIIVGGSASGLAAAINAKRKNDKLDIAVLEKLPRVGKKILSTGNGRCNLTNLNACPDDYNNSGFTTAVFDKYPPEKVIEFFGSLSLLTYSDKEGRVYPRSNMAASVLDALRYGALRENIELITDYTVTDVKKNGDLFCINNELICDKLIIATGGKSSPAQGSDGSGYKLAKSLGHNITNLFPALVPVMVRSELIRSLKGIRASGVKLTLDDLTVTGEILFTDFGISGIAAMELASEVERKLYDAEKPVISIDFLPEMTAESLKAYLSDTINKKRGQHPENLLTGILPKQLGISLLKSADLFRGDGVIEDMSDNMLNALVASIKNFEVTASGTKGFVNAQVTSGGLILNKINPETMKSTICDNLYFCGEILDIDGPCGGYNLQWAFASGLLAGELK